MGFISDVFRFKYFIEILRHVVGELVRFSIFNTCRCKQLGGRSLPVSHTFDVLRYFPQVVRNSLDFSFLCGFFIFQSPDAIFFPQMQRPVVHIASGEQNVSGLAHTLTLHDPACIGHTHKPCGAGNLLEWVGCSLLAQVVNQQNADAILISKLFQCTGLLIVICIHSAVSIAYTHFLKRIDDNQANIAVCMNQRFYLFL